MKPTVLHLQKVAGISGSEAHLLSLLPRLKESVPEPERALAEYVERTELPPAGGRRVAGTAGR